jgi:hypothetical protein
MSWATAGECRQHLLRQPASDRGYAVVAKASKRRGKSRGICIKTRAFETRLLGQRQFVGPSYSCRNEAARSSAVTTAGWSEELGEWNHSDVLLDGNAHVNPEVAQRHAFPTVTPWHRSLSDSTVDPFLTHELGPGPCGPVQVPADLDRLAREAVPGYRHEPADPKVPVPEPHA